MSSDNLLKELRFLWANPLLDYNLDLFLFRYTPRLGFLVGTILALYTADDLHGLVPKIHS